jgi:hypothetical protein
MNRKKNKIRPSARLLSFIMALALSLPALTARATEFVLLYSGDNIGEIEPCG